MKTIKNIRNLFVLIATGILFGGCPGVVVMDDDMPPPPPPEGTVDLCDLEAYRDGDEFIIPDRGEDVDYILTCNISISDNVTLTIMPGVTIEVENGLYLSATGQAAFNFYSPYDGEPIIIRGRDGIIPSWKGIFMETTNPNSYFSNVTIEDAGTEPLGFSSPTPAGALVVENSRVAINYCQFENSLEHGLVLWNAEVPNFTGNNFVNNLGQPMAITPSVLGNYSIHFMSCEFSFNWDPYIRIVGVSPGLRDAQIFAAPLPYFSTLGLSADGEGVTVYPGTHIIFQAGKELKVGGDESSFLSIEGTPENPVILEGEFDLAESWEGIIIDSDSPFNRIDHTIIRNASVDNDHKSAIQVGRLGPGRCIIENTTIENSECGIFLRNVDEITTDNLTFVEVDNDFCED